ncbi:MAG TPA: TIGR03032 family protein [Microcoleaceae bacterium UBA9251]|jgi:TIGR03032 family protein|nr:TIGR03032 family protein [Microcoleaceae cyanobacterium UBA9251]
MKIGFFDAIAWDYDTETPYRQPLGGSQSALCYLAVALAAMGHEVYLCNHTSKPGVYRGVNCCSLTNLSQELLTTLDAAIVLNHPETGTQLKPLLGEKTKLILWMQHACDQPAAKPLQCLELMYDSIIFVSEWQKQLYLQQFNLKNLQIGVMKNAIAPAFERLFDEGENILTQKLQPPVLTYTSTPFRGLDLLLDIFPKIRRRFPGVRLKVFSSLKVYQVAENRDEWEPLYQRCAETAGVEYVGSLTQPELARELRSINILAYPNTFAETSCISVMEALASGCFVVTSNWGSLPETTAGFARLISLSHSNSSNLSNPFDSISEREAYAQEFIATVLNVLEWLTGANSQETEHFLRRQVDYFNKNCTWKVRALEWEEWLKRINKMSQEISVESLYDRAWAMQKQGDWEAASREYLQVIALQPNYAPAYFQLGNAKLVKQEWREAIALYRQALNCEQRYSQCWYNLGVSLENIGEDEEAIAAYQQAVTYNPNYAIAYNSLGGLLTKQENLEAAKISYQKALAIQPDLIPYLGNLANIQYRCDQYSEAAANYQKVLQLDSNNISAMTALVKIHQGICEWENLAAESEKLWQIGIGLIEQNTLKDFSVFDFIMYSPFGADKHLAINRYFSKFVSSKVPQNYFPPHIPPAIPPLTLRIGYISGDFYSHALTHLIGELFALHDRAQFEIFVYSLGPNDGSFERKKVEADCDQFTDLRGMTTSAAAEKIYNDGIHILIDMGGYTQYSNPEILAMRPAAIQINYLTYASTMGAEFIDYIIIDNIVTPSRLAEFFSEKFICLPNSYQINNYLRVCPAEDAQIKQKNPKAKCGLPEDVFVFACFNHSRKIEPVMFSVWMGILEKVPNSVLWLLDSNAEATRNLKYEAKLRGIKGDRLIFAPRLLQEEHLSRHIWIDLFLDTLYYNAHTTGSDALWMGIPFITCPGETFASRVGASLLNAVNLPQLIVNSLEEYEKLAVHLATHPQELQKLKDELNENRRQLPLFNTPQTVRYLELGYLKVWERYQSGESPEAIQIDKAEGIEKEAEGRLKNDLKPDLKSNLVRNLGDVKVEKSRGLKDKSMDENQNGKGIAGADSPQDLIGDRDLPSWLTSQQISIACTTYQTSRLMLIGSNPETNTISGYWRIFDRAMGLYCTPERLYLSSKYQLWQLDNVLESGKLYQGYDKLYIPRIGYTTGDIDIHDIAVDKNNQIIFISTLFNCIATLSDRHSCKPLWKPPFISQYINEDRCHLNGLAMVDGEAKYVTAVSQSDVVDGWRDRRKNGGIVIDIESNDIIVTGLSMPHSPRWYQDKLWLLNSGRGELGYVDLDTGKFNAIAFCPGYLRGLAFWQNWAIVGLSKPRGDDKTFGGLELDELLAAKDAEPRCGMMVIDLNTGAIVHWLRFEGIVTELYDVQVIPAAQKPMALGFKTEEIAQLITLEF